MNNKSNKGYCYFISNNKSAIKIGFVFDKDNKTPEELIDNRLKELKTGNPDNLELIYYEKGSMDTEWAYHKKYESENISGEWFKSELILKEIKRKKIEIQMQKELGYI